MKLLADVFAHLGPLVFIAIVYGRMYMRGDRAYSLATSNAFLMILIYIGLFDVRETYGIDGQTFALLVACCLAIYLAIFRP